METEVANIKRGVKTEAATAAPGQRLPGLACSPLIWEQSFRGSKHATFWHRAAPQRWRPGLGVTRSPAAGSKRRRALCFLRRAAPARQYSGPPSCRRFYRLKPSAPRSLLGRRPSQLTRSSGSSSARGLFSSLAAPRWRRSLSNNYHEAGSSIGGRPRGSARECRAGLGKVRDQAVARGCPRPPQSHG